MKPHRIMIIGLGNMGKNHLRIFSSHPLFEVVAIIDPELAAQTNNINLVPVYESLPDTVLCDCAVVSAPTDLHCQFALQLINKQIPTLIEKPLCATSKECKLIKDASDNNTPCWVGHVERFNPVVKKLKEVITSGWIGSPLHYCFTRVGGYPKYVTATSNVLADLAIHDIDIFQYLTEEQAQVIAAVSHCSYKPNVLDTAEILLSGNRKATASIHVNWITPTKVRTIRVTGTRGVCFVDYILQTCSVLSGDLLSQPTERKADFNTILTNYPDSDRIEFAVQKAEPLKAQAEAFALALKGSKTNLCTIDEGMQVVTLVEAAIEKSLSVIHKTLP